MGLGRLTLIARAWVALLLLLAAPVGLAATAGPSPSLAPADVVRLQLEALRNNDARGAYRFASPGNRRMIGSATNFARMLESQYADMLTQTGARVTLEKQENGEARVLAELQQVNGQQTAYLFFLSRQHTDGCDDCWMTDGVFPLQPKNKQPLYSI